MKKKFNFRLPLLLFAGILMSLGAAAQRMVVRGHVQDQTGEPVVFASVVVVGTKTMTNTDANGNFTIAAQATDELRFSYIGYKPVTEKVAATMLITLEDLSALQEAVVIGYGTVKKNDLTGSVTAIKPDEKNKGLVVNAQDMMQGKIAGVNVVPSTGEPGAQAQIRIRGGSSLNASNDPLYVIDGLAIDNSDRKGQGNILASINPADIESFVVLKDASATAIYGSRGSNGVIIITTKKGHKAQKPRVSYTGYAGVSFHRDLVDVMNADQYRAFITEYYGAESEAASKLGPLTGKGTDWQSEIYHVAVSHEHNVTVQGGLKNMPYRISLGYTDQDGILRTSGFERYTAGVVLNPSFLQDHLTFNINAKFSHTNTRYANTSAVAAATRFDPTQTVRSSDPMYANFGGYFQWVKSGADLNDGDWAWTSERNAVSNPVALLNMTDEHGKAKTFIGNIELDYKVHGLEDLRVHMNLGGEYDTGTRNYYQSPFIHGDNTYYGRNGFSTEDRYNLSYNAYLQYYKDFNEKHHFDIMGGYEWQHFHYSGNEDYWGTYRSGNTGVDDDGLSLAGPDKDGKAHLYNRSFKSWKGESYLVSFFGRANYILLDRYLLTATVRYDGSSRFDDHWALFPSFALGWRIKNEKFLKDVDFVSELKLRLGYGQTGQQDGIGNYNYFASYTTNINNDSYYPIMTTDEDGGITYRPDAYNKNLKWETTTTYNAGIDFGILKGKLSGSVDYYYRKTTDLINTVYVAAGSNFRNQVSSNIGELKNQGVEISLTYKPISSRNWYWEITANAAYNDNEITKLTNSNDKGYYVQTGGISAGTGNYCQAQAVGHPINSFHVYQQVYDEAGKPIEGCYVDRNADGQITTDDLYYYKSPNAPWTAGLSSRLQWKNWDLGFALRASFGNYVFNDTQAGFVNIDKTYDSSFGYLQNRPMDAIRTGWVTYDNALSDRFVQNASFLKCDNITLGYSFDNILRGKKYEGVSGRVYVACTNVFTITKYKGNDPEVAGGIDNNLYPRPTTVQVGVSLNF